MDGKERSPSFEEGFLEMLVHHCIHYRLHTLYVAYTTQQSYTHHVTIAQAATPTASFRNVAATFFYLLPQ